VNAYVVYESLWGNTAAIARAVAEGIGPDAVALSTGEATPAVLIDADLLVAGAPLLAFTLPTERIRDSIKADAKHRENPPDLEHPSMRWWLEGLAPHRALGAAFETRILWSPGSSAGNILRALTTLGHRQVSRPKRFLVTGVYGPLKKGELEKARAWGEELARSAETTTAAGRPQAR